MSETSTPPRDRPEAGRCEIRLKGHLDGRWVAWFDGLRLTLESGGITTIQGPVVDVAALYGVLQRVRDAGLPLVSLTYIGANQPDVPTVEPRSLLSNLERNPK